MYEAHFNPSSKFDNTMLLCGILLANPSGMPDILVELSQAVQLFLIDQEAVKRAYDPLNGIVRLAVTDQKVTPGSMDFLVRLLNESGYVCRWEYEQRPSAAVDIALAEYATVSVGIPTIYFAVPT